ncbi:ribosomal protein S5 domain 2-type protein [Tribonema minus]|uniref:Ribosomal protein S5 domain 2-type protein n=1 Tax=Tribonema minus TaxID=303371 RepID=A0A836CPZ6_9STRA|nr:ribosomal protein S5 domain 2-type protein [Tribonema minus]
MSSKGATTDDITTVVGITAAEDTIKKSRFIGYCCAAPTFADGMALLDVVKGDHPKARHVCWAWQGVKTESRYNDDGEPSGTAGQPILASIQGEGLSQTFVAVVRYFGGVLLGTGGLVRAYGGTARLCLRAAENGGALGGGLGTAHLCLRAAEKTVKIPQAEVRVEAPMALVGALYAATNKCVRVREEFTADAVILTVSTERALAQGVIDHVIDATRGAAKATIVGE